MSLMTKPLSLLALIGVVALTGCTTSSVNKLQATAEHKEVLEFERNYQAIYRDLKQGYLNCFTKSLIPALRAETRVDADLYSDLGQGSIALYVVGLSPIYTQHIDIKKVDSTHTEVVVSVDSHNVDAIPHIQEWATNGFDNCELPSSTDKPSKS